MEKEKAYKLLAVQMGLSNSKAKELIDRGVVYVGNKKVAIARGELPVDTKFRVLKLHSVDVIYENNEVLALNKPAFLTSDEAAKEFQGARLLHRLDRETSGVLLLAKTKEFEKKALEAFKARAVYKVYSCWVEGIVSEPMTIDKPLKTIKQNGHAYSKVDRKGKDAVTHIEPIMISGKRTKLRVIIETGRTHQIRVHLKSIGHPIIGDRQYGVTSAQTNRMLLHALELKLLGYDFKAKEPKGFDVLAGG
ncbi:RluA family pseudouridine synthase [Hydrogenimonas cancrithermarum]|uniref:RNA pseudouridylate synthase n=1 Tax=Hydrogenimonas cancrithermarum TaxID=2993563 RepID=A0ABM8FLW7_9BACT|nr:RluA family pseudouridine synthase [Hydrogenimonas cancrithermarum]BDY13357.1 putative RNA pseudouridine synthase [Hydrogenimonas cancrithermarum]